MMGSTCPICLDELENKVKAQPNACDHVFCLQCLEKWSKLGSYCPIDRKRYTKIVNLESDDVIQVKPNKRKRTRIVYDFSTKCEKCLTDESPDTLLLCDCCDLGFHCGCLNPPLPSVPAGPWFCPTCVSIEQKLKKNKGITKENEADYSFDFFRRKPHYDPESPSKNSSTREESTRGNSLFPEINTEKSYEQSSDDETIVDEDLDDEYRKKTENLLETCKDTNEKDSSSHDLSKGTVSYSLYDSLKYANNDKRPNLVSGSSTVNAKKEVFQFSIFQSISNVEASQRMYVDINEFAGFSLSSGTNLDQCSLCKDMISYASQKLCKICKLKYFKRHSWSQHSEKRKQCAEDVTPTISNSYKFTQTYSQLLQNKRCSQTNSMSKLERRKNSLFRELKRIQNKKFATSS